MTEENRVQEFKFKKIVEKIKYLIEELKQIELIFMKHNEICKILNYTQHLLFLTSTVTGCVSISDFTSLVAILVSIESSEAAIIKK